VFPDFGLFISITIYLHAEKMPSQMRLFQECFGFQEQIILNSRKFLKQERKARDGFLLTVGT